MFRATLSIHTARTPLRRLREIPSCDPSLVFASLVRVRSSTLPLLLLCVAHLNDHFPIRRSTDASVFTPIMYTNLGVEWAGTVVGFIALIFIPAPILFWKFGARIRMSSKYAREADAVARVMAEKAQRERMIGSAAASAAVSRRGSTDGLAGTDGMAARGASSDKGDVDVEKALRKRVEEGGGARIGGEADAMALPAVEQSRAGTVDVLEKERP